MLHTISNELVEEALGNDCTHIVFEQLRGIRERLPHAKAVHKWAFHRLFEYVTYKAESEGIVVKQINPAYTSQRCSKCGFTFPAFNPSNSSKHRTYQRELPVKAGCNTSPFPMLHSLYNTQTPLFPELWDIGAGDIYRPSLRSVLIVPETVVCDSSVGFHQPTGKGWGERDCHTLLIDDDIRHHPSDSRCQSRRRV